MKTTISVLVTSAICCSVALAQDSASQSEEARAMAVLGAFRSGNLDALLDTMNANWVPPEDSVERAERWQQAVPNMIEEFGDREIVRAMIERPHVMSFATTASDGPSLTYTFEFEPEEPHRIVQMRVSMDQEPGGPGLPPIPLAGGTSVDGIGDAVRPWIDRLAGDGVFSGSVLIAVDGTPVFTGAWGKASIEWDIDNRVDTRFDLGSINKSFTQIAIAQLTDEGKLTLDDHVIDHIPDYPNKDAARKITIRHLVTQTSGLGDIFVDEFFHSSRALYREPRDFFPLFANQPLTREPGEKREYSNAGYMVLGVIIANVSGMPYSEYVTEHVFKPAGMSGAGFFAHDEPVPNVAVGYTHMGPEGRTEELQNNLFHLPIRGNSAGRAQASVADLLNFDNAVREYRLLPPDWTEWYFGGAEPTSESSGGHESQRATEEDGIAGGAPGVNAVMEGDGRLTVIVLSNFDPPVAEDMGKILFGSLKPIVGGE